MRKNKEEKLMGGQTWIDNHHYLIDTGVNQNTKTGKKEFHYQIRDIRGNVVGRITVGPHDDLFKVAREKLTGNSNHVR